MPRFKIDDEVFIIDLSYCRPSQRHLEILGPYFFIGYETDDNEIYCRISGVKHSEFITGLYGDDQQSYLEEHLFTKEEVKKKIDLWLEENDGPEWYER